tara:strand:- start:12358 stop:13443 length:1086 start_codon:yes stop_codon:yes gene_type:complete
LNKSFLNYKGASPKIETGCIIDNTSWIIGNTYLGKNVNLSKRVVLRGDGAEIKVGKNVTFLDRSTVHVASDLMGSYIGDYCIIGRYSLVHACVIGDKVIIGDQAIVMDGSNIGNSSVITANSLIPPGKIFPKNSLISGAPAKVVGNIKYGDYEKYREEMFNKDNKFSLLRAKKEGSDPLVELGVQPWGNYSKGKELINEKAYVAPDAILRGNIKVDVKASIWFATIISSLSEGNIHIGEGSNIQDNTIIDVGNGDLNIGKFVTVGHNVRLGACSIANNCLIGMGCTIEDGAVVEENAFVGARAIVKKNTRVKENTIFVGRPAKYFREVKKEEAEFFKMGQKVYEGFAADYIEEFKKIKNKV